MAYSAVDEQQIIGPFEIWGKTYALPGADFDWNSVSGYTELFEIDKESDIDINLVEEFVKRMSGAHVAPIGDDLVGQDLTVSMTVKVKNLYSIARALGLLDSAIEDKTADDPTRLQFAIGGHRTTNWQNLIIRQEHPDIANKYFGFHLLKAHIRASGGLIMSLSKHQEIPITIQAVVLTSGTYEDQLSHPYEEYGAAAPVIDTILPASQSIGDVVVITGRGFGASQGDSKVTFNSGKDAVTYYNWADGSISVLIPASATTGNVTVTVGGVESSGKAYTIA